MLHCYFCCIVCTNILRINGYIQGKLCKWVKNTLDSRGMMVRVLFYGLLLVGPCALTESHALHIRMKQKCALTESVNANEKNCQEFQRKIAFLDVVGMSAIGLWLAWLGFAFVWQVRRVVQKRRSTRNHKLSFGDKWGWGLLSFSL